MKLKELDPNVFQKYKEINFDVSKLYFDYEEKEIYSLLKQNILTTNFLYNGIDIHLNNEKNSWESTGFSNTDREKIDDNYGHFFFTLANSLSEIEKQSILDLAIEKNKHFAAILLENPEVKLTETQFNNIFNNQSNNYNLKKKIIQNKSIPLTVEQINDGLLNGDSDLNVIFAERAESCVTKETINALMNETNSSTYRNEDVLEALLKNKNLHFDEIQIDWFLHHDNFKLRVECALNYNLPFTERQIQKGLNDEGFEYEMYDDTYNDYSPKDVIFAFLSNPNVTIPKQEIDSIIYSNDREGDLLTLVEKPNLKLTEEQIDAIISKNSKAMYYLAQNDDIILNDNQLLKMLYSSIHTPKFLAEHYLTRDNVTVSDIAMNILKISPCEEIQKVIKEKGDKLIMHTNNKLGI